MYAHVNDATEWDDYEWSWIGSLTEWALNNPGPPDAAEALTVARKHRDQWLRGYRNVLGFVTLVLTPHLIAVRFHRHAATVRPDTGQEPCRSGPLSPPDGSWPW